MRKKNCDTRLDVGIVYNDVVIAIGAALLVEETQRMH